MRRKKSCSPFLESANFLTTPIFFFFFNKAIKTSSSHSGNTGSVKFLAQYFGRAKKGKLWGCEN